MATLSEARTNNYCVWYFITGTKQASVFRYNQTLEDGAELAKKMTEHSNSPEILAIIKKQLTADGYNKLDKSRTEYYCTIQEYGQYGESLGAVKTEVLSLFNLINPL